MEEDVQRAHVLDVDMVMYLTRVKFVRQACWLVTASRYTDQCGMQLRRIAH